jgi:hypothetical protein
MKPTGEESEEEYEEGVEEEYEEGVEERDDEEVEEEVEEGVEEEVDEEVDEEAEERVDVEVEEEVEEDDPMPKYQRHLVEDHIRLIRNILSEIEEHNASLEEFNLEQMQDLVSKIYSLRDFLTFDVTNPITKQELFDKYLPEDFIKYLRVLSVEMSQDPSIKQKIYEVNAE